MKTRAIFVTIALWTAASASALASDVHLRSGEMTLSAFLEEVSERLDLSIDASAMGSDGKSQVSVPEIGALTAERARELVLTTLNLNGYTWIEDGETGLIRVLHQRSARDQEIPLITEESKLPNSDLMVTYALRLAHAPVDDVARVFRSFSHANSRIIPDEASSSVLITDSARNILKLIRMSKSLDTPEVEKASKNWKSSRAKRAEASCPGSAPAYPALPAGMWIALFSLIALVIGFLARGYVIRRIEGGL